MPRPAVATITHRCPRRPSGAPTDPGRTDERPAVTQAAGHDLGPAGEVDPAAQVHLRLGRREERLAETQGHRSAHDGERQVEQVRHRREARPTSVPVRSTHSGGASRCRPPGQIAASAVPDASASRQPRLPHGHGAPVGDDDHVTDVAGVARAGRRASGRRGRCRHPPRSTRPWRCSHADPAAAPTHPSPSASALASLSTNVGRPVSSARPAPQGKRSPARDVQRRHLFAARAHRSPAPDAADDEVVVRADPAIVVGRRAPARSAQSSSRRRRGRGCRNAGPAAPGSPSRSTRPAAILVPPMSTARARSATDRGLLTRGAAHRDTPTAEPLPHRTRQTAATPRRENAPPAKAGPPAGRRSALAPVEA